MGMLSVTHGHGVSVEKAREFISYQFSLASWSSAIPNSLGKMALADVCCVSWENKCDGYSGAK